MEFNLLILPLLGGYIFTTNLYGTKYHIERQSGYRLIFISAISGAVFLLLASLFKNYFVIYIWKIDFMHPILTSWSSIAPFPYSGITSIAFLIGSILWFPLNYFFGFIYKKFDDDNLKINLREENSILTLFANKIINLKSKDSWTRNKLENLAYYRLNYRYHAIKNEIYRSNNGLVVILFKAYRDENIISITTDYGKVYAGKITSILYPEREHDSIRILPLASGYRNPDTQELIYTINYTKIYSKILNPEGSRDKIELSLDGSGISDKLAIELENFQYAINYDSILSANNFDINYYIEFINLKKGIIN